MIRKGYEVNKENLEALREVDRDTRVNILKDRLLLFMAYYTPDTIEYPFSDFHYEMEKDIFDLRDGVVKSVMWIAFRESAKTTLAKASILHDICYQDEEYINVDSFDGDNSERILVDIVRHLQNNPLIKADFGELYNEQISRKNSAQKKITNFVTNQILDSKGYPTKKIIRVSSYNTQEPVRGRLHNNRRPTKLLLDDFENKKTINSEAYTKAIKDHINEFKTGLDQRRGKILYIANYISDTANVQELINKAESQPQRFRYRIIPVIQNGEPRWPQKYVMNKEELAEGDKRIPLDIIKEDLHSMEDGDFEWNTEMMCDPTANSNSYFTRQMFVPVKWEDIGEHVTDIYITIDTPSPKEKGIVYDGDYCGICINYKTSDHWNFEIYRFRTSPSGLLDKIFMIYDKAKSKARYVKVAWEDTHFTRGLELALKEKKAELASDLIMYWLQSKSENKDNRIKSGLLHRYENGGIRHIYREGRNTCHQLESELLKFGRNPEYDDCMDASAYQHGFAKDIKYKAGYKISIDTVIKGNSVNIPVNNMKWNDVFDLISGKYKK